MPLTAPVAIQREWLPTMDLNHDKQIQSLLCYRYTSRQRRLESTIFDLRVNHPGR